MVLVRKEFVLKEFGLFWPRTILTLNRRKPENSSLLRQENNKEIKIKLKETTMVEDGED